MQPWKTRVLVLAVVMLVLAAGYYGLRHVRSLAPTDTVPIRFNVLLIVSDALRQDVLGCYGGNARTPNIDWLAANGALFENAYSTSPWTAPSSVSMLTGNYATAYGCSPRAATKAPRPIQIYVPHSERLLATVVAESGYVTAMQTQNINATMHNNLRGFDVIPSAPSPQMADSIAAIVGLELESSPVYRMTFAVVSRILQLSPEDNFYLLHWILDPHAPYDPIDKFVARIDIDESLLPKPKHHYQKSMPRGLAELSELELEFFRKLYAAEVESVDERVGFLLAALRHKGLYDDTYIIFTSDHGEQFGEHGLLGHGGFGNGCHYYESLVKVPLIVAGPGIPEGTRISERVSHIDLTPTIEDLLGVDYEEETQGTSYKPLLMGQPQRERALYFDDVRAHVQRDALLEQDHKLIAFDDDRFELYDLQQDPSESNDVAASNAARVRSMADRIVEIRKENGAGRQRHIAAMDDSLHLLSEREQQRILKQLKALGYID